MSHLDAYISRYGDFCVHDNDNNYLYNNNNDTTDYFTPYASGCLWSLDWISGLDHWTELLDWLLTINLAKIQENSCCGMWNVL